MKKNYNIPATEVVALAGEMVMQFAATSPTNVPDPNNEPQNIPGQG